MSGRLRAGHCGQVRKRDWRQDRTAERAVRGYKDADYLRSQYRNGSGYRQRRQQLGIRFRGPGHPDKSVGSDGQGWL